MAEFKLNRIRFTWKGPWVAGYDYNIDDIIEQNGKTYVAKRVHTSATFTNDLAGTDVSPPEPKWELQSDGALWRGSWAVNTQYEEGNIVKYGSAIYKCTEGHRSSPTFTNDTDGLVADINKWTLVAVSDSDWKNTWSTNTLYKRNDIVRYNGIVYKALNQHISATTNAAGLESNQSDWAILADSDAWKGVWEIGTRYRQHDIVKYGGIVYRCIQGHTSADNEDAGLEEDQSKWELLVDGIERKGNWLVGERYKVADIVRRGGSQLKCNTAHTSSSSFSDDESNWDVFIPGSEYEGQWDAAERYQPGDIVQYGGYTYKSLTYNVNTIPSTNTDDWDVNFTGYRFMQDWNALGGDSSFVDYLTGDVVRFSGNLYIAIVDNTNVQPGTDDDIWEKLIDGRQFRNFWEDNVEYFEGDMVTWQGTLYRCINYHRSIESDSRPDLDIEQPDQNYWVVAVQGTLTNKLARAGDLKTWDDQDSTAVDTQRLAIGTTGQVLRSTSGLPAWDSIDKHNRVYYVGTNGIDDETQGGSVNAPFRTVRFACNYILRDEENRSNLRTRYFENATHLLNINQDFIGDETVAWIDAQIDAGTGIWSGFTYDREKCRRDTKILVRGLIEDMTYTGNLFTRQYASYYYNGAVSLIDGQESQTAAALEHAKTLIEDYVLPKTTYSNPINDLSSQVIPAGYDAETGADTRAVALWDDVISVVSNGLGSLPTLVPPPQRGGATIRVLTGEYAEILPISIPEDVAIVGDELRSTVIRPASIDKDVVLSEKTYVHGVPQEQTELLIPTDNKTKDMFYVRNGCGIRNLTLKGLEGELGEANNYGTQRPTAGAYVSLDPGEGPTDQSVWVRNKSTYVQGVTTLGTACVGMKIDGALHDGGNKSCVANDFTQVLSDGIGYWAANLGRSELVSVFTYYNHIGYLAENGGILRATNGNNSYGKFGSVAEGYDLTEIPIQALVDNRAEQAAANIITDGDEIVAFGYTNAGQEYTNVSATYTTPGSGINLQWKEFRQDAISDVQLPQPEDSTTAGGAGYKFITGYARGGSDTTLELAQAEVRTQAQLLGMAVFVVAGTGAGQYGYINSYDEVTKVATIYRYSTGTAGWDNLISARGIEFDLDETTFYEIEPRVNVPQQTWVQNNVTGQAGSGKMGAHDNGSFFYPLNGTNDVYVTDDGGDTWTLYNMDSSQTWAARTKHGPMMMFIGNNSDKLYFSNDGSIWDSVTLPSAEAWSGIAIGGTNDDIVMVTSNDDVVYKGTITTVGDSSVAPSSWTQVTLNAARDWVGIEYGQGTWVVASIDGYLEYSINDGASWTQVTLPAPAAGEQYSDIAYGNNTWILAMNNADRLFYSADVVNWLDSDIKGDSVRENWSVAYSAGTFVAVGNLGGTAYSDEGVHWTVSDTDNPLVTSVAGSYYAQKATFLGKGSSDDIVRLRGGKRALMRVNIRNNNLSEFEIFDPGSGYVIAPTITMVDPEEYIEPQIEVNVNNDVLAQPEYINRGTGCLTVLAKLTGDGFAEAYQTGTKVWIKSLPSRITAGTNVRFASQPDTLYKVVKVLEESGTAPNLRTQFQISPVLNIGTSPVHEETITFRRNFSQVRLTGHDFLDIGTGNFEDTNYPDLYKFGQTAVNETRQANEVNELNGGRVFYTSTDQDGNFRVGELFKVSQATGGVTLNADFFDLEGLEELRLGGIQVGGTQAIIREFSTDNTFTANSDNVVPTQKALKAYIENRITGGGATVFTNSLTAGVVVVTSNVLTTTEGVMNVDKHVNMNSGQMGGDLAAQALFHHGHVDRDEFNSN